MKVLTIKQPWATLIMLGDKRYEFRTWKTKYRGDLLIHAGKGIDKEAMKRLEKYLPVEIPLGKILGQVKITDCVMLTNSLKENLLKENPDIYKNSEIGLYGWKIEEVQVYDDQIEIKGRLGLWNYEK